MPDDDLLAFIPLYPGEDELTILARWREWANEGRDPEGDASQWTDTREGAMWWVHTTPMRREVARVYDLMGTEVVAAAFPQWSWGEFLDDHAELRDIARLPATPATGVVTFSGAPGSVIPAGTTVGVEPADPDADAPEFETDATGSLGAVLTTPAALDAVGTTSGGTLPAGSDWAYRVTAVDIAGQTLPSAEDVGVVPGGGAGKVTLTWGAVAGSIAYRVYRADSAGGAYGLIKEVTAATWVDTGADAPNLAVGLPVANSTGGKLERAVTARETGSASNVGPGAVTAIPVPPAGVTAVTNDDAIVGGTDPQTDPALKERVLDSFVGAAVANQAYYRRVSLEEPGVGRVTVVPVADGPGTVLVIVSTEEGDPVSEAVRASLQERLDPDPGQGAGEGQVGAEITVETATTLAINIAGIVEFEDGYAMDAGSGLIPMRDPILASIGDYVDQVESGGEVVRQKVIGQIMRLRGVHDVGSVTLNGAAANVAVPASPPKVPTLGTTTGLVEGSV